MGVVLGVLTAQPTIAEPSYFIPSDLGSSARMIRLGNVESFAGNASSVFENPSAIYGTKSYSVSLFYTKFMNEVGYQNFGFGMKLPNGVLGIGYMGVGVTGIPFTSLSIPGDLLNSEFKVDRYFNYGNSQIKVAYGLSQTKNLHLGVGVTYYSTSIDQFTGSGVNVDVGAMVTTPIVDISAAVRNIVPGLQVRYSNGFNETLPLQTVLGGKLKLADFSLLGQVKLDGASQKTLKSAGLNFKPRIFPILNLSGGYKEFAVIDQVKSNITMGLGLDLYGLQFDYAFEKSDHVEYNNKHYFSVAMSF